MTAPRPPTPSQVYRQLIDHLYMEAHRDARAAGDVPAASGALYLLEWVRLLKPQKEETCSR